MNPTIEKFGYPATLIREFEHWVVLLRPAQPTLGSLVLAAKSEVTDFSALPPAAFAELEQATKAIETALRGFVDYAKINYLMLMMVDPQVHFHVIPRYDGAREWGGHSFTDAGWPKVPDLGSAIALTDADIAALREELSALLA
ncbi:HIT family protein [Croceicoccus naphthovorans]|uniref:HIT family hydrolase n=1 Tax=Croceicoccus naphthovorans TaxID=1348774 RepID=A0A0G3XH33_9SPHN|nr:HIT family protein [Croceicoccus naphthovorans]AKM09929.1 HIT family hydrolase [Croceicoccus naphthovorans]MBB3990921.1 diadenosine tetraphosphate (Ap4A) HIT family hydrolase [Croceicoccus naphthovorans]